MAGVTTGSKHTKLIIIRGNSGSGKTTIARQLQRRLGRGCALIEQDYLRRIMLVERDKPGGIAPGLIDVTTRYILDRGYHAILEGILATARYQRMLTGLVNDHAGDTAVIYLDVCLTETLRRHETRPQITDFTADDMRAWYQAADLLGVPAEQVLPEATTIEEAVTRIAATAGLPLAPDCESVPRPPAARSASHPSVPAK